MPSTPIVALVVDDEPSVRKLACSYLKLIRCNVLEASSGDEALRLYAGRELRISLLVADVQMPEMDGITLADRLKTKYPNLEVVFMSRCCSTRPDAIPGATWIRKPFGFADFLTHVRPLLERVA